MPEKRRTRTACSQVKAQRGIIQTTLKDLFQRTNSDTGSNEKTQDPHFEHTGPVARPLQAADPQAPAQASMSEPCQLFPILTKVSSVREGNDTDIIDITDTSDVELSTERHLSSTHLLTPRSEFSQATSHSLPPSPVARDVHCYESDTSLPHVGTCEQTHPHNANGIKESNKRTLGLGDVVPLPSSCSQHVRGVQHSYTSGQAPFKRSVLSSFRPPDEGTLDFLINWRQLDDTPSTPLTRICQSLTLQQCGEYLQSLSRNYTESHPAFAQISIHQEGIPLRHAEMWTRRFRPRRANEVLGNERHARYLRDWLSALELRLQDRQPEEQASQRATTGENKEKSILKRVPRGIKRPRVIRAVTRNRGNKKRRVDSDDDLDDFVVFSDADEQQTDDPPEDSEDELAFCQRTFSRLRGRGTADTDEAHPVASNVRATETNHAASQSEERAQTNFADNLTNTLLITGPPGCGKTAAVYACAEELGWEIFEVYPGIGRRNGASLDHLVGDVGKNHIVQTVHRRVPMKPAKMGAKKLMGLDGYLAKSKTGQFTGITKSQEAGTEGRPINVEDGSATHEVPALPLDQPMASTDEVDISGMCDGGSEGSRSNVRQSLVLLEEVDILFKEDAGFWPAVVDFIRSCQRPVVMTCNDAGLVPVGELPLQNVLVFEPCPSPVAASFLQCLSLTEGWLVPHEDLVVLYETTHSIDGLDTPDAPHYPRTGPLPLPDLRRSITQLQILCAGARQGSTSEKHQGDEAGGHVRRSARTISAGCRAATPMGSTMEREWWRQMKSHSELMSHVDAQLCRSSMATREALSMEGGGDDGTGHVVLSTGGQGLVYCRRDELIADEAVRHSRGLHEGCGTGPMGASISPRTSHGFRARVEYQSRVGDALQGVLEPPARMPQRSVFLDYIPWVRHMVAVDDVLERETGAAVAAGRRRTRNSMGARHVRTVGLSEGQRRVLTGSGLGGGL